MAITIRDTAPRKRNIASLVGGVVIAVGCFVLWVLVAEPVDAISPQPAADRLRADRGAGDRLLDPASPTL